MRKHCPCKIYDDLKCSLALSWTSNTKDIFLIGLIRRRQAFRHHALSIRRRSEVIFIVVPLGKKVTDATFRCLSCSAAPPGLAAWILLTHRRNALTSRVASTYTSSKRSWIQVGLSPSATKYPVTVCCFNGTTIYAILESIAVLSFNKQIVATINHYDWELSRAPMM
jgi:hypothetical protein